MNDASKQLDELVETNGKSGSRKALDCFAQRLRALGHLFRTVGNAAAFQTHLDVARQRLAESNGTLTYPPRVHERDFLVNVYRDEINNVIELAGLIERAPMPVLKLADDPADEDPYLLPPALARKLRRKARIMNRHWEDLRRVFPWQNEKR